MQYQDEERYFALLHARATNAEESRLALHRIAAHRDGTEEQRDAELRALRLYRADLRAAYPPGFWEAIGRNWEGLDRGDPAAVEHAIVFIEADLWFFRSGYIKGEVIRHLNRVPLSDRQAARLRRAVLDIVDGRERREFRRYCRLALKVDAPELRTALADRLNLPESRIRRHAEWMLAVLESRPVRPEFHEAHQRWYRSAMESYDRMSPDEQAEARYPKQPRAMSYWWGLRRRRSIRRELTQRVMEEREARRLGRQSPDAEEPEQRQAP